MNQGFGQAVPARHTRHDNRQAARYLVLISSGGFAVARLFLDSRVQVAEIDASTEEVALMIRGLPSGGAASGAEWDRALTGHSAEERAAASVYVLDV